MSESRVLEIAICKVADTSAAETARQAAMEAVRHYPGFLSWRALSTPGDGGLVADLVEWESLEAAKAAAEKVHADPAFLPCMKQITAVSVMDHFDTTRII